MSAGRRPSAFLTLFSAQFLDEKPALHSDQVRAACPECLHAHFRDAPLIVRRSGDLIQREDEPYDDLYWVESGLVGQAVINHELAKPLAMNLYPPHTMLGFINLFSGLPSPRRLVAQLPGAIRTVKSAVTLRYSKEAQSCRIELSI